jgi:hypothetical protein
MDNYFDYSINNKVHFISEFTLFNNIVIWEKNIRSKLFNKPNYFSDFKLMK